MAKRPIMAFMSYSDEDEMLAQKFKKELARNGINAFLDHTEIKIGGQWSEITTREIKKREFFIMLLTWEYHRAEYTDQECGMAIAWNKTIIPIIVDRAPTEGFIQNYRLKKCECNKIKACVKKLRSEINHPDEVGKKTIDYIIKKISQSSTEDRVIFFARHLHQFESFTVEQINRLLIEYLKKSHSMKGIAKLVIADVLNRNYAKISARNKSRLDGKPKSLEKAYVYSPLKSDKYAVSQDYWKKIEIKIHKASCGYIPEYLSHDPAKWFFAPTLSKAREMARGLGKMYGTRVISCQYCQPGEKGRGRHHIW